MALKHSYTLLAPIYDPLVNRALKKFRIQSLSRLNNVTHKSILINGIGTGLDIPYLPKGAKYTGTDITPAMLKIAQQRASESDIELKLLQADSLNLPFENDSFDHVIMHLILAVVPEPERALYEACRVLKPDGKIYIFDKFLKPGQLALIRRALNLFLQHVATRTDVVFEDALYHCPKLRLVHDKPSLANGWFRLIELQKK